MSSTYDWKTLINGNLKTTKLAKLNRTIVQDHPLKNVIVTERIPRKILGSLPSTGRTTPIVSTPSAVLEPLTKALEGLDPLTALSIEETDPLTRMASEAAKQEITNSNSMTQSMKMNETDSWNTRKAAILSKFTTSERLSIITSFLSEGEKVAVKAQSVAVDKVQHRLEQLDTFEDGSQRKLDLSQSEYVGRIEQLNKELVSAWHTEQRVKALKIAIQCSKLLADTAVLSFYPSKFVLITDILDNFGQLVYSRLRTKADYYKPGSKVSTPLPEDFTPKMVPDSAKETCLNWFYKIASIRELVPRVYVEISLLRCYNFLSLTECEEALQRLIFIINGIGNPLVAIYVRCYLTRVGLNVMSSSISRQFLIDNFNEFLHGYHHLFSRGVKAELIKQNLSQSVYLMLFTPALDYIMEIIAREAPESLLNQFLETCKLQGNSSLILNTIMTAFKPTSISLRSLQFLEMISNTSDQGLALHVMLRTLGLCLSICPPPMEQRRKVLNVAWKYIGSIGETEGFISCTEAWTPFIAQCFTYREVNTMLGNIIDHLSPDRSYESYYNQLKYIIEKIVSNTQDAEALLIMDNFLPLVDLFQQESVKVEVCKMILNSFGYQHQINDPVVINALLFLCNVIHDSMNALTPEDECRQIGNIICRVVRVVDYGRDFEQQLSFYVESRGMFSNSDLVLSQLVQCVNTLSVNTSQIVKCTHTRKTSDFVRACAAYCFITIPSIKSLKARLELYLLSGQVALFNQCLGQADASLKGALHIFCELQETENKKLEQFFVSYIKNLLSVLLVVPDNPDCSVLNLSRILLNILRNLEWESYASLVTIYLSVIDMLSIMAQEDFPYHIDKVESNDSLYGSDPKFIEEINKIINLIIGEILSHLKQMGSNKKQSMLAIELFTRIAIRSNLNSSLMNLAVNLWNLGLKPGLIENKILIKTKNYLKSKSYKIENTSLQNLIENLNMPC